MPHDHTDQDRHDPPRSPVWADQPRTLAELATIDLDHGLDVRPTMVAFRGDGPLFLATLRPFPKGGHHDAIIEVGALALGLGARRMALSLAGRAWSTRDPMPPVLDGVGDLRQHVVVIHSVDAESTPTVTRSIVHPVSLGPDGGAVVDPPVVEADGSAVGWVVDVLRTIAEAGEAPEAPDELVGQVRRCERLGHQLAWGDAGLSLLVTADISMSEEPSVGDRRA